MAFHTPSEVKAAVTGEGRAGKAQVTAMVTRLLALAEAPRPADAADALALAICHCWRAPMLDRMAQARARSAELARGTGPGSPPPPRRCGRHRTFALTNVPSSRDEGEARIG